MLQKYRTGIIEWEWWGVVVYTFDRVASLSRHPLRVKIWVQKGDIDAKMLTSGSREIKDKAINSWEWVLQVRETCRRPVVVDKLMASKDFYALIPGIYEYITLHGKRDCTRVSKLRILR